MLRSTVMRVALVHDWLTGVRGGEKCLEVFCELFPEGEIYTLVYDPNVVSPTIKRMRITASWINRLPGSPNYFRYLLPLFPCVIENFSLPEYDLVLSSSHCVAKGIFPHRALHVSYVHAPMRYVWDRHEDYFRGGASWAQRAGLALCRPYLQRWDIRSAGRVDRFIANSRNVAEKIENLDGRTAKVIYPPVDVKRFHPADAPGSYYLIVSALVPYKRIDIAVDAFNAIKLPLKIAGDGPLRRVLERRAKSNIEFLGWVDDQRLAELYAGCTALIFPGEEDFGIVPLEAQACGRPVIGFQRGGLLETVVGLGGVSAQEAPTGLFFADPSPARLITAVELYQKRSKEFCPDRIRQHAEKFSRERFKREIADYVNVCMTEFSSNRVSC